ncbi:response regulator [Siphonobacter sp. SORGH_AS_0500]|uniref:response regulator n=1 Tax=Siphonobacter sp. SORGH_AS_0500 TaxID=1864824 RepID=UPI0018E2E7CA|nr:response regulator [Siphonobacter sp. SORGH_AS_0500]MDR6195689.1 CheY-like chemotaxis protein [Siphonobacter sp. SORGH_AS_0500]
MKKVLDFVLLMAEDDSDDRDLFREALEQYYQVNDIRFVSDGQECCDYLKRKGRYENPEDSPRPGFILLDLNMPRKNGKEVLKELKNDPDLKKIPVVVLTTSHAPKDIQDTYDMGTNSYLVKPSSYTETLSMVEHLGKFWFNTVKLPPCG